MFKIKVNSLFKDTKDINIVTYLQKHNIQDVEEFLTPTGKYIDDYSIFIHMEQAVNCGYEHINKNSPIYIVSDADVDGVTSTVILYQALKHWNANLDIEILIHEGKERGLDDEKILNHIKQSPRPLVFIPDAGTNDVKQHKELHEEYGIDIIVLDHHNLNKENYSQAMDSGNAIIVNNQLQDCNKDGSGCLVTHKFIHAMDNMYGTIVYQDLLDLVGLSLVADSCNLASQENRAYLYFGLLNQITNPFLQMLVDDYMKGEITVLKDLSFKLIPKINSVVRSTDQELKMNVLKAFIGEDKELDLKSISKACAKAHRDQQKNVAKITEEVIPLINDNDKVILVEYQDMLQSYTGLVAGKISGEYQKPVIMAKVKGVPWKGNLVAKLVGSLRSPIPMQTLLNKCPYVDWCSGHEESAGIQIDLDKIDDLKKYLSTLNLSTETVHDVCAVYDFNNTELFGIFEPYKTLFGQGLPMPLFAIKNIRINGAEIQAIGKARTTIKFNYKGLDFIMFFKSHDWQKENHIGENIELNISVIGELGINEYNGNTSNQVIVSTFEATPVTEKENLIDKWF